MTTLSSKATKTVAALVAACALGLAAAPSAQAGGWRGHHHGYGYGAAALGGGLLLGALIASNSRPAYAYARDCWLERQKRHDAYGNRYFVKVRVCD